MPTSATNGRNTLLTVLLLVITVYVAHYLNFLSFGLYEDDYYYISANWRFSNVLTELKSAILAWPQGRPIGFSLPPLLSLFGGRLGGLPVIYAFGFLVLSLNTCLFYALLRKVGTETIAVTGALAYCLYPADTTHILLTHSFQLQTALTFWLVGAHLYLSGRRVAAYIAITASLLTYETPYMVFLAVPLLRKHWGRTLFVESMKNGAILAGIVLTVGVIRLLLGEERVGGMSADLLSGLPLMIAESMVIGPTVSMAQFFQAPMRARLLWSPDLTIICAAALAAIIWMLHLSSREWLLEQGNTDRLSMARLYLAGLAMLCLAYVLSFTHYPPVEVFGRGTSVHLASALGGSLLFACVSSQIISISSRFRLRGVAIVILSLYLSVIVGYRVLIQADFARAWDNQRAFWTSAIGLMPDITDGTVIFAVERDLPQTQMVLSYSWANPLILSQLFDFPAHWLSPPRLFVVPEEWSRGLAIVDLGSDSGLGKHLEWMVPEATWESHMEVFPDANVIVLEMQGGKLVRRQGTVNIGGVEFRFKPLSPDAKLNFEKGPLFNVLIGAAK